MIYVIIATGVAIGVLLALLEGTKRNQQAIIRRRQW